MAIEVQLPDIGADAAEVTEILVTVGDSVELDAPLLVVEGEKAAMEIPLTPSRHCCRDSSGCGG